MVDHVPRFLDLTAPMSVGLVSTFPPTRCGIARFSESLIDGMSRVVPAVDVDVVRLIDGGEQPEFDDRASLAVQPDLPIGLRAAARRLNQHDCVILQHEYGIYGRDDGESVIELVRRVHRPKVAVLHTVVAAPTPRQRRIIEVLSEECHLVTLSESARSVLENVYGIDSRSISVIPHGSNWSARPTNPTPRHRLITWGLLGPGKGLERLIGSLPGLRDLEPTPHLDIVGRTHPNVSRRYGSGYRDSLVDLANRLGVGDMVTFTDRYLDDSTLHSMVAASDVVVVPYDNHEQISSGVLIEALAAGRPVVATEFPHAVELLDGGAGIVVDHDSSSVAAAVRALLTDPVLYERSARLAREGAAGNTWTESALRYSQLLSDLARPRASLPAGSTTEPS